VSACCSRGYERFFGKRVARRDARRYRRRGLDRTAQRLVDELAARDVGGASVLEPGGGVGGLDLELLKRGAAPRPSSSFRTATTQRPRHSHASRE